ncbi:MAG: aspartate carbamoyltransferase, partial [Eikenella corrodens]|nr:aspartate carbamoyltransferase [Eikenella corrodens]
MSNPLYGQHLISIPDLSNEQLECLLDTALRLKREPRRN